MTISQKRTSDGARKSILFLEGGPHRFEKLLSNGEERWVCSRKKVDPDTGKYCTGSARKRPGEALLRPHIVHSPCCVAIEGDMDRREFVDELHRVASTDDTLPSSLVVDQVKHGRPIEFLQQLPNDDSLMQKVVRRRNKGTLRQLNDVPFSECVVPQSFCQTISGAPYLLLDHRGDGRVLVFSSHIQLTMLAEADEWGMDANFTVPRGVMQRFVIVAHVPRMAGSRDVVPFECAVAFMERRRACDYKRVLQAIKSNLPPDRQDLPRRLIQDFEQAIMIAATSVFPQARIHYCLFHYTQCLGRAVKKLRLRNLRGQAGFDMLLKGLRAIPFLPPDETMRGALELFGRFNPFFNAQPVVTQKKLQKLAYYFRDNFAGYYDRNAEGHAVLVEPRFPESWNCWLASLEGRARTNNYTEGKNRASKRRHYRGAMPKLGQCILVDRKEEWKSRNRFLIARARNRPITLRSGRRRATDINRQLQEQCRAYEGSAERNSREGRMKHLKLIGDIMGRYRRRAAEVTIPADEHALNEEEVNEVELGTPGATEEDS
jgi:hypothetical protein